MRLNCWLLVRLLAFLVLEPIALQAKGPVWASAPKPVFPKDALSRGSEGYVVIRAFIGQDGHVTRAAIARSSGDSSIDHTARAAVLDWIMNTAVIRPEYGTKGYEQRIDFRQLSPAAARYRDRVSYFGGFQGAKKWIYAPTPEYPERERRAGIGGSVAVAIRIGADGRVESAALASSSGNANLDNAAVAAVRHWRAHREFANQRGIQPVSFASHRHRW